MTWLLSSVIEIRQPASRYDARRHAARMLQQLLKNFWGFLWKLTVWGGGGSPKPSYGLNYTWRMGTFHENLHELKHSVRPNSFYGGGLSEWSFPTLSVFFFFFYKFEAWAYRCIIYKALSQNSEYQLLISSCPTVLVVQQIGSHWTDFHEILYFKIFFPKIFWANSNFSKIREG
jgi:hypothetical protein